MTQHPEYFSLLSTTIRKLLFFTAFTTCFIGVVIAQAPPTIGVYGPNHYNIRSYDGLIPSQVHQLHIQLAGPAVQYRNWSIRAMIIGTLHSDPANVSGQIFPTEKLKFRFIDEQISGNPPQPHPTVGNLQLPLTGIPFQAAGTETPIITQAMVPLATGGSFHVDIRYNFKIDIDGGRYLGEMLSDIQGAPWNMTPAVYRSAVRFMLYDENQQKIASQDYPIALQVHRPLADPPPDEGTGFNIEISSHAREGVLSFTSPTNYIGGNSITYDNGIKVSANTGYQVQVKSLQSSFLNEQGQQLPLDVLEVRIEAALDSPADAIPQPVRLSNTPQTIVFSGTGGQQTHFYDLQYATEAGDSRLLGTRPGRYSTVLLYELTPR